MNSRNVTLERILVCLCPFMSAISHIENVRESNNCFYVVILQKYNKNGNTREGNL